MTRVRPDLDAPWWEQFPELLDAEAQRFRERFRPAFELYHDPRDPQPRPESYCKEHFVWRGEIAVRVGKAGAGVKTRRFTVDFVYPAGYPFKRVRVFPVGERLRPTRHLEPGGNLCYMPHMPNAWTPSTQNVEVLRCVRNWFHGYLTDWRLAEQVDVPEYRAYVQTTDSLEVFLPGHLYNRMCGGYGILYLEAQKAKAQRRAVAGQLVDHQTGRNYVCQPVPMLNALLLGNVEREPLAAVWFDAATEPLITSADDLFRVVASSGSFADAYEAAAWLDARLQEHGLDGRLLVFLRFRAASNGTLQWSAYTLRPATSGQLPPLPLPGVTAAGERVRAHMAGEIHAVPLFPVRPRDLFRRLQGVYDAARLHDKRVTIIGCGALGSPAAALLARAGVGRFLLVDGDRLAPWNVTRHELDFFSVGQNKADALALRLRSINPYISVHTFPVSIDCIPWLRRAINDADVVVVAIADEAIEHLISRVALEMGKTALYARGLAAMAVGRIHRVVPGKDACPVCLCQYRGGPAGGSDVRWINVSEPRPLLVYDDNCGAPAIPGAAVDTEQIAGLLARKALDVLLGNADEENQWVWVGRSLPEAADPRLHVPETTYAQKFEPLEGCQECRPHQEERRDLIKPKVAPAKLEVETPPYDRVELTEFARESILAEAASCGKLEGGGVLAGYVDAARRTAVVTHATDGGPNAVHRAHFFMRDTAYCQALLDGIDEETDGRSLYVGEWHKHAAWDTTPSPTDRASLVNIATQPNYAVSQALTLICGMPDYRHPERHVVKAYSYRRSASEVTELPLHTTS